MEFKIYFTYTYVKYAHVHTLCPTYLLHKYYGYCCVRNTFGYIQLFSIFYTVQTAIGLQPHFPNSRRFFSTRHWISQKAETYNSASKAAICLKNISQATIYIIPTYIQPAYKTTEFCHLSREMNKKCSSFYTLYTNSE